MAIAAGRPIFRRRGKRASLPRKAVRERVAVDVSMKRY